MLKLAFLAIIFFITSCNTEHGSNVKNAIDNDVVEAEQPEDTGENETLDSTETSDIESENLSPSEEVENGAEIESFDNEEITDASNITAVSTKTASISFESKKFNFGRIIEGDLVEHTFTFVNKGDAPLIIKDALAKCGCTVPEYSKEPVAPGDSGTVNIHFDSQGRLGQQEKMITIVTNGDPVSQFLLIEGIVGTD